MKIISGNITSLSDNSGNAVAVTDNKLNTIDQDAINILNSISAAVGGTGGGNIFRKNEVNVTSRNKFDLTTTTYTVPTNKKFSLTFFGASYDASASIYVRFEKQTGGSGPWETLFRLTMMAGGQGEATDFISIPGGVAVGIANDIFKITIESSIAKGTIWSSFVGSETNA